MPNLEYFQCIPLSTYNTASISGTYAALNASGFASPIRVMKIYNAGSAAVTISYDGVTDHDIIPAGYTFQISLQANHADNSAYGSGTLVGRQGQIIYGKGTAGTGNLYISGYF